MPSRASGQRLALSWLDRQATTALVEGDATELAELIELARGCAEALAGEDANGARRRLLSREIAIAKGARVGESIESRSKWIERDRHGAAGRDLPVGWWMPSGRFATSGAS